nr:DUF3892 domain-containing protein [Cellulosimicrobium sp. MM]
MPDYAVTHSGKNWDGDITAIGVKGSWQHSKSSAISNIENGVCRYFVNWPEGYTWIRVVNGATGKYLRTDRDGTSRNNLDDLPDL